MSTAEIRAMQEQSEAEFIWFGPGGSPIHAREKSGEPEVTRFEIVQTFGSYEAEYAAIRKGVGILHEPHRGLLRVTGKDRQDLLHRLLTQDIRAMKGGESRRAFQLNHQGRITADVIFHHGDLDGWLEGDRCDLPALAPLYDSRIFTEDVQFTDISDERVALALHGPMTGELLRAVVDKDAADAEANLVRMLDMPATHHVLSLCGDAGPARVTCCRRDLCGVTGVRLWVPVEHAGALYARLADAVGGLTPNVEAAPLGAPTAPGRGAKRAIKGRGVGWLAFNTARIEAGSPLYHVDFGPDTIPAETGAVFNDTVSLNKGCYLGQEIVARMHALGHPKRVLVGIRFEDDRLPIAGAPVYAPAEGDAAPTQVIGGVTSSTLSPLLGNRAIALAMMKWGRHRPDTAVTAPAEGGFVKGMVSAMGFPTPSPSGRGPG